MIGYAVAADHLHGLCSRARTVRPVARYASADRSAGVGGIGMGEEVELEDLDRSLGLARAQVVVPEDAHRRLGEELRPDISLPRPLELFADPRDAAG